MLSYQIHAHAGLGDLISGVVNGFFNSTEQTLNAWIVQIKQTSLSTKLQTDNQQQSIQNLTNSWGVVDQQERIVKTQVDYGLYGQSSHLNCQNIAATEKMGLYRYNHQAHFFQQARSIINPELQSQNQSIDQALNNLKDLQVLQVVNKQESSQPLSTQNLSASFGVDRAFFYKNMAKYAVNPIKIPENTSCGSVECDHAFLAHKQAAAFMNMSKITWIQP